MANIVDVGIKFTLLDNPAYKKSVDSAAQYVVDSYGKILSLTESVDTKQVASATKAQTSKKTILDKEVQDFDKYLKDKQKKQEEVDRAYTERQKQQQSEEQKAQAQSEARSKQQADREQKAQGAISKMIERNRSAISASFSQKVNYNDVFTPYVKGMDAIAAASKRRGEIEAKAQSMSTRDIEKQIGILTSKYKDEQTSMRLANDNRTKAEIKNAQNSTQEQLNGLRAVRNRREGSDGKSLFGAVKSAGTEVLNSTGIGSELLRATTIGGASVLAVNGLKEIGKAGIDANERIEKLALGFRAVGQNEAQARASVEALLPTMHRLTDELGGNFRELQEGTARYLEYGGTVDKLPQKMEVLQALAIRTGKSLEDTAKFLVKGTDPEIMAQLTRMGIKFDDNASAEERFAKISEKVGPLLEGMRDKAKGVSGDLARLKNGWEGLLDTLGVLAVQKGAPVIKVASELTQGYLAQSEAQAKFDESFEKGEVPQHSFTTRMQILLAVFTGNIAEADRLRNTYTEMPSAIDPATAAIDAHAKSLEQDSYASQRAMLDNTKYYQALTDQGLKTDDLKKIRARLITQKDLGQLPPGVTDAAVKQLDNAITAASREVAMYDKNLASGDKYDLRQDKPNSGKATDVSQKAFDAEKKRLEEQMNHEIAVMTKNGILLNDSKESIERHSLQITERYEDLIANAAKKHGKDSADYELAAIKAKAQIRDNAAKEELDSYKNLNDQIDAIFLERNEAITATGRKGDTERYENDRAAWTAKIDVAQSMGQDYSAFTSGRAKLDSDWNRKVREENAKSEQDSVSALLDIRKAYIEERLRYVKNGSDRELQLLRAQAVAAKDIENNRYKNELIAADNAGQDTTAIRQKHQLNLEIITNESNDRAAKSLEAQYSEQKGIMDSAASSALSVWEQEFFSPLEQELNANNSVWGKWAVGVLKSIMSVAANKLVGKLTGGLFDDKGGDSPKKDDSSGGNINMLGIGKLILGALSGFASGGSTPVGKPYIVGEKGPEIRIDDVPGTIIPNHLLSAATKVYPGYVTGTLSPQQEGDLETGDTVPVGSSGDDIARIAGERKARRKVNEEYQKSLVKFLQSDEIVAGVNKGFDLTDSGSGPSGSSFLNVNALLGKGFGDSALTKMWKLSHGDTTDGSQQGGSNGKGVYDHMAQSWGEGMHYLSPDKYNPFAMAAAFANKQLNHGSMEQSLGEHDPVSDLYASTLGEKEKSPALSATGLDDESTAKAEENSGRIQGAITKMIDSTQKSLKANGKGDGGMGVAKGLFSSVLGALPGGSVFSSLMSLIPGFASGGDNPVGKPYMVGENGPELRFDKTPGTIVSNANVRKAMGAYDLPHSDQAFASKLIGQTIALSSPRQSSFDDSRMIDRMDNLEKAIMNRPPDHIGIDELTSASNRHNARNVLEASW